MSWYDAWSVLSQSGPLAGAAIVMVAFFLWRDWRREMRLLDRVEALEKEQKEVLLPLVEQCAKAIAQNTVVMQRLEKMIGRCTAVAKNEQKHLLDRLIEDAHDDATE
jgi:hypothetical protein